MCTGLKNVAPDNQGMFSVALLCALLLWQQHQTPPASAPSRSSFLDTHVLVTWYGNPRTGLMGVLGEHTGAERADGLRRQAAAYDAVTTKKVMAAYEVVAVVAQCTAGNDAQWRRRETADVLQALLDDAHANGFKLVLDIQPGRSSVTEEVAALRPFLSDPDVYLALDPEFAMSSCEIPGQQIGEMSANDINGTLTQLEQIIAERHLPPKVLIVHQFRLDMLPNKKDIRVSPSVDVVLTMDGFGSQSLKRSSYKAVMDQGRLAYAGIKLFYKQDTSVFTPAQVMAMTPRPSVVIYQ